MCIVATCKYMGVYVHKELTMKLIPTKTE